jgi:hypothetical protein
MRKIDKDFSKIPASLLGERQKLKGITKAKVGELKYDHEDVKKELNTIYKGKCAFCEQKRTLQIEHYRPTGNVEKQDLLSGKKHSGYFWLKIEWSNLLYACHDCNRNGVKGTRFPIKNRDKRIDNPEFNPDGMPKNLNINELDEIEQPLIINPEVTDPLKHLKVNVAGELVSVDDSEEGDKTIEVLQLKRDDLILKRKKIIDNVKNDINFQFSQSYFFPEKSNPLNASQLEIQLKYIFDKLVRRTEPEIEFTLVGYCMIHLFEELIIAETVEPFKSIVKETFVKYCLGA